MGFQTQVFLQQGFGVVGSVYNTSAIQALPYTINSASAANNVFGRAVTQTSAVQGFVQAGNPGGTNVFAGYLINPKAAASFGTGAAGPLAPTLQVANYTVVEVLYTGTIIVNLPVTAKPGDLVVFDNTTGVISTVAPGADVPVGSTFGWASVLYFINTGASLGVIDVHYVPAAPAITLA